VETKVRCADAGLRINGRPSWSAVMWEKITSIPPSSTFAAVATVRVHQADKDREHRAKKEVKECRK